MASVLEDIPSRYQLYIDGKWVEPHSGRYLESYNPSTSEAWYEAPDADAEDVDRAVKAAQRALVNPEWRRLTPTERGQMIHRFADLLAANAAKLGEIDTRDNGRLLGVNTGGVEELADVYRYFAGMADKLQGNVIPVDKLDTLNYTTFEPIGVVAAIVPWNSPLGLLTAAFAPSLAVGNTLVVKPSEHTSASSFEFAKLVEEAGFPPGVINIVSGYGETTGQALITHPGVNKVAFTGSSETGKLIAAGAAKNLVSCSLELGGKSPHVVFEDADLDRAAAAVAGAMYASTGQSCIAGSRCFLHKSVHDEVLDRLIKASESIRIGSPLDADSEMGPLSIHEQLDKVKTYVGYGVEDGAQIVTGGGQPKDDALAKGWFFEPTIFTNVSNDMRIAQDEIFGPVLSVLPFNDESELIEKANDTRFGLAAGVWTQDIDRAMRFAREVEAGTVWINTYRNMSPMAAEGGFKHSGYGKQNGFEAMHEFTRLKNVVIDYSGKG